MSLVANAIKRLSETVDARLATNAPFRAIVSSVSGNKTYIHRLAATTADAEPYAKVTGDALATGDEVLCLPVNGKPVIIGKVRR